MMSFTELGLSAQLLALLKKNGYETPYPIQATAIPAILAGKDVLGIAQTGSGKTASFALPILQQFQTKQPAKNRHITALILVPTRELAMQVGEVFKQFSENLERPVKSLAVFGGVSINPQMIRMQGVEILVATPGRLLDLLASKALSLSELDILVLDEADKMLNMGFRAEMNEIFHFLPQKRQNLLFSATLGKDISTITEILLQNPIKIEIEQEPENLDLIKEHKMQQVLVFTSSIQKADAVTNKLKNNGVKALAMHSEKSQGARTDALRYLKSGEINVVVATDLASRGIDIPSLPVVINYELPRSPKDFIHRIGRTGRAGVEGLAISLILKEEEPHFYVIQKKMGKRVKMIETDGFNLHGY